MDTEDIKKNINTKIDDEKKRLSKEFESRIERLEEEAIAKLELKGQEIKQQIEGLAEIKLPSDLLAAYLRNEGKIWISNNIHIRNEPLEINNSGRLIMLFDGEQFLGTYRVVIFAVPSAKQFKSGEYDDYGQRVY